VGTVVSAFASGLEHPRWLYLLPNGDVLVAGNQCPARPDDGKGIKGYFFKKYQTKAGGAGAESEPQSRSCAMPMATVSWKPVPNF
jgi:glucose/arabinose dehydrogenase